MAVGKGVGEGGNAAVGVDGEEEGLLLGIFGYVNLVGCVGEAGNGKGWLERVLRRQMVGQRRNGEETKGVRPEFFKSDRDLYAIGSLGCVEIDIGGFVG